MAPLSAHIPPSITLSTSVYWKKCYQSYKVDGSTAFFFFQLSVSVVALMHMSPKCFVSRKQAHDETKTNQTRWEPMTPQHFHTIPTSMPFLVPLTQICFMFVSCVKRRVVEGSGLGSGECMCSACWCACGVSYVVGGCNGLACMQKLWSAWAVLGMLVFKLCCEILFHNRCGLSFMWKTVEWT